MIGQDTMSAVAEAPLHQMDVAAMIGLPYQLTDKIARLLLGRCRQDHLLRPSQMLKQRPKPQDADGMMIRGEAGMIGGGEMIHTAENSYDQVVTEC